MSEREPQVMQRLPWKKRSDWYWALRAARSYVGRARFGEPEYQLLDRWVGRGGVAVDVGANLGVYAFRLAGLVGRQGRVVAIEPLPAHVRRLRRTARLLRLPQLEVVAAAAGANEGTCSIAIPILGSGQVDDAQAHVAGPGEAADYDVDVVRLDDVLGQSPRLDLVKVDVEGAECDMLTGGIESLTRLRPVVVCEAQDEHAARYGYTAQDLFDLLHDLSYRPHVVVDGEIREISTPDSAYINYVFLPRSRASR